MPAFCSDHDWHHVGGVGLTSHIVGHHPDMVNLGKWPLTPLVTMSYLGKSTWQTTCGLFFWGEQPW
jgi:hypothetical protein